MLLTKGFPGIIQAVSGKRWNWVTTENPKPWCQICINPDIFKRKNKQQFDWHLTLNIVVISPYYISFKLLCSSDAIWRNSSRSLLNQAMVCCLMAPSHYLNRFWLIINKVQRHSSEDNLILYLSKRQFKFILVVNDELMIALEATVWGIQLPSLMDSHGDIGN